MGEYGVWGVRPFENVDGCVFLADATRPVTNMIGLLLDRPITPLHYQRYRAAAWLIMHIGRDYAYDVCHLEDHLLGLIHRLKSVRDDKNWVDAQSDPDAVRKDIEDLIQKLQHLCEENKIKPYFTPKSHDN